MATFQNNPEERQRLDYRVLQNGWSSLYWQQQVLDADLNWFKNQNFDIARFGCTNWKDVDNIHNDFKTKLNFPDYYGENLDALNDCLSDTEINDSGTIIVFHHFQ